MGVRDLGQVIKRAPSAVQVYPSLASFSGKSIAIDGNLQAMKFYFASASRADRYPHQHLDGWYRFILALQQANVKPIVVFDGDTRLPAKARENAKRKDARQLQIERGKAESERTLRLEILKATWDEAEDRTAVLAAIREANPGVIQVDSLDTIQLKSAEGGDVPSVPAASNSVHQVPERSDKTSATPPSPTTPPVGTAGSSTESCAPADSAQTVPATPPSDEPLSFDGVSPPPINRDVLPLIPSGLDEPRSAFVPLVHSLPPGDDPVSRRIRELYTSFEADSINPIYSKNQRRITDDERQFFDGIFATVNRGVETEETEAVLQPSAGTEALQDLVERSTKLGQSHEKRGKGVPKGVFQDAKLLLEALGVPVYTPSAEEPYEAEGICAALYLAGHVSFVASEDTDVAVYGAPLLRRITTVAEPSTEPSKSSGKKPKASMDVVDPVQLETSMGLSHDEFVDFALLCGTDFTERIYKLGPLTAHSLIKEHGSIEAVLDNQSKFSPDDREAYLATINVARTIFLNPPPVPSNLSLDPKPASPSLPALLSAFNIAQYPTRRGRYGQLDQEVETLANAVRDVEVGEGVDMADDEEADLWDDDVDGSFELALSELSLSEAETSFNARMLEMAEQHLDGITSEKDT